MSAAEPRVLQAANPSPMTLDGTRTFIVGRERPVVIDPGPDAPRHLDAIERALGGAVPVAILLTHAHGDHADAAAPLAARTGAPVWRGSDGDEVNTDAGPLRAIATPGHTPEHLAFLWDRQLFAGDAFMGGSDTTLVAPPEGTPSSSRFSRMATPAPHSTRCAGRSAESNGSTEGASVPSRRTPASASMRAAPSVGVAKRVGKTSGSLHAPVRTRRRSGRMASTSCAHSSSSASRSRASTSSAGPTNASSGAPPMRAPSSHRWKGPSACVPVCALMRISATLAASPSAMRDVHATRQGASPGHTGIPERTGRVTS